METTDAPKEHLHWEFLLEDKCPRCTAPIAKLVISLVYMCTKSADELNPCKFRIGADKLEMLKEKIKKDRERSKHGRITGVSTT